jgi:isopentenyl-diphosphate delta-isomerase
VTGEAQGKLRSATDPSVRRNGAASELVVLVDAAGRPIGSAEKWATHHAETPLHLAFSCYVFDAAGLFLITRRALAKKVWPGVWSNTVCGHPAPGESLVGAIERRLQYELGMKAQAVEVALPHHLYQAPPFEGIVEHEFCPVYVAQAATWPQPNPHEVDACGWVEWDEFVHEAEADTRDAYSWWCKNQLKELKDHPLIAAYARGLDRAAVPPTEGAPDREIPGAG